MNGSRRNGPERLRFARRGGAALALLALACAASERSSQRLAAAGVATETATFAAGCYWCSEAAFERIDGVVDVVAGFMGGAPGDAADPRGLIQRGHAEVVQVTFDPERVDYGTLLDWFWRIHDPTSIDRQGDDEGPEYRSEVFVHDAAQRAMAERSRSDTNSESLRPIVTAITPASEFYPATEDQQDYFARNRTSAHCREVIAPHLASVGLID